ncbi:polyphosphate kinase 2 [Pseudolysinimonas sp.]|jgi:polyphosphate kinase 2|uniref:polyphosphate kinase 2 n=1 Tax=Pseudolysinimonas sp. TaxID=2680009 RepID=UPI003784B262
MATKTRRTRKALYEEELARLQIQLVEMQQWVLATGTRVVVLFEGRDAAGKGGAIKRIVQYLNPRSARVVALHVPSEREKGQWYFQRHLERMPTSGEIVLFDRSWYNRAGVEKVMGYCTDEEYERFLAQAPIVEKLLVDDGVILVKYWFSVSDKEQQRRFKRRQTDPVRRWKLSPTDLESIIRWEDYSRAKDAMIAATDTEHAPWWIIDSDDKRAARLNAIKHLLSQVPYEKTKPEKVTFPDRPDAVDYVRPPVDDQRFVPDHAAELAARDLASAKS